MKRWIEGGGCLYAVSAGDGGGPAGARGGRFEGTETDSRRRGTPITGSTDHTLFYCLVYGEKNGNNEQEDGMGDEH